MTLAFRMWRAAGKVKCNHRSSYLFNYLDKFGRLSAKCGVLRCMLTQVACAWLPPPPRVCFALQSFARVGPPLELDRDVNRERERAIGFEDRQCRSPHKNWDYSQTLLLPSALTRINCQHRPRSDTALKQIFP